MKTFLDKKKLAEFIAKQSYSARNANEREAKPDGNSKTTGGNRGFGK